MCILIVSCKNNSTTSINNSSIKEDYNRKDLLFVMGISSKTTE